MVKIEEDCFSSLSQEKLLLSSSSRDVSLNSSGSLSIKSLPKVDSSSAAYPLSSKSEMEQYDKLCKLTARKTMELSY